MRRLLAVLLTLLVTFTVAGCSSAPAGVEDSAAGGGGGSGSKRRIDRSESGDTTTAESQTKTETPSESGGEGGEPPATTAEPVEVPDEVEPAIEETAEEETTPELSEETESAPGDEEVEETYGVGEIAPPVLIMEPEWMEIRCRVLEPRPVGAFSLIVTYDPKVVRVIDIEPIAFGDKPENRKTLLTDTSKRGMATVMGYHIDDDGPRGDVALVRIRFEPVGEGETAFEGTLDVLADPKGTPIPADLSLERETVRVRRD